MTATERFAGVVSRRWCTVSRDDIAQEAALLALEAGQFGSVQRSEVIRRVSHWASPVHLPPNNQLAEGYDLATIRPVALDVDGGAGRAPSPEDLVSAAQLAARVEALNAAILRAEQHAARGLPKFVREMGAVVHAGRFPRIHVELGERYGLPVAQVVSWLGKYRRTVARDAQVQALRAAYDALLVEVANG